MPYHSPIIPIDTIHPHTMAEGTGFEPVCGSSPRIAFQASRLSLSRNLPVSAGIEIDTVCSLVHMVHESHGGR